MSAAQPGVAAWMERFQVPLYLAAIAAGAALGVGVPSVAGPEDALVNPALALLIYATFLGVPAARLGVAVRDHRFILTLLTVNFLVGPAVAWVCTRLVANDPGLLTGAVLVLVCPCVDYVMVFTGLAGGDRERLLATSPLLMLTQMCLLPLWLWWFVGPSGAGSIRLGPFVAAFVWLILVPLLAAWATQWWAARSGRVGAVGGAVMSAAERCMVALMMLTLALVVAAHSGAVGERWRSLLVLVPVYVGFGVGMVVVGLIAGKCARLPAGSRIAVVFSGVTRNSLVVLPLALSWGDANGGSGNIVAVAVVTQTLVELVLMVVMVRLVPIMMDRSR
ncbi:MAG: arsenic resistance protein [Galactobacter sp.]